MLNTIKMGLLLAVVTGGLVRQLAWSEVIPDAGSLRREIEQEKKRLEPQPPKPVIDNESQSVANTSSKLSVKVDNFLFTGNTLVESEDLQQALVTFRNRPLSFADLEAATARVAEVYRQEGWIARPYLPPQDVSGGTVTIAVVEATFGQTRVNTDTQNRISAKRLIAIVKSKQAKGQFLNADNLDHALRHISEWPGISIEGSLKAGEKLSETDLVLKVNETARANGNISLDNAGSKYTGEQRLIASGYLNSPFGRGERLRATLLYSEGTTFGQLNANMPIGNGWWRAGGHVSTLDYSLGKDFGVLGAEGSSSEFGVDASYSLLRSRNKNASLALSYNNTNYKNSTSLGAETEYTVNAVNATLSGHYFDSYEGINQGALVLAGGGVDNTLTDSSSDSFSKIRLSFNRQQRLSDRFALYGAISVQQTGDNLTSSEKFTLGGPYGVRAYPASQGSGDAGHLLSLEVRMGLPRNVGLTAFYDTGGITVDKKPSPGEIQNSETPLPNHYTLSGAGLSAFWQSRIGFSLKATWAKPIGSNKGASSDQEKEDKDRIWLQASMAF